MKGKRFAANAIQPSSALSLRIVTFFIVFYQLLCSASLFANTYYVSTAGSDGNSGTSIGSSWRNINYAVNYAGLVGGDIVYISGGTYFEKVVMYKSGTANNYITIKNYDANIPIINGTGRTAPPNEKEGLFEARGSYVIIDGLKVINSRSSTNAIGILVAGPVSYVTVRNCITNNTGSSGIAIWGNSADYSGATNIIIEYNDISAAVTGGYQEHLTIAGGVDTYEIRYNKVHDQTALPNSVNLPIGIDSKTNVRNGKVYGNEVYNLIRSNGIYVDGYDNTAYNIEIYNNIIHHVENSGISIGAEEAGTDYNIKVYNNLIYNTSGNGIVINNSNIATQNVIRDIFIYNNTVYGCAYYAAYVDHPFTSNVVFKNNIFSQNVWGNGVTLYTSNKPNVTVTSNVTNGVMNAWQSHLECYVGLSAIPTLPLFVDANTSNFHLAANSPAKDVASSTLVPTTDIEGNPRPSGAGYDIGAYEYVAAVNPNNMLINPGFESPLTVGWTADWGNSVATSIVKNSGVNSLQVGPGQGGRAQIFTSGFIVGRQYKLSAFCMMSATGGPAGTNIGVVCKDVSGARTGTFESPDITNINTFQQKSVTFTIPANTIQLEVFVWYPGGTPVVYVDDFVFNEVIGVLALGNNNTNRNNNAASQLSIFSINPNPASEKTIIHYGLKNQSKVQVLLYDAQGVMVAILKNGTQAKGNYQIYLQTNAFPSGLYFVKIRANETEEIEKLIISK